MGNNWNHARWRFSLAAVLFLAGLAGLQTSADGQTLTQVTATITDPHGLPYSNATVSIALVPAGGSSPHLTPCSNGQTGCPIQNPSAGRTDNTGTFSVALWANASILPASTQWQFTIGEPGVPFPFGTGPQTVVYAVTIFGATQSLSSAISALAPALTVPFNSSGGSIVSINGTPVTDPDFTDSPFAVWLLNGSVVTLAANTQEIGGQVSVQNGNFLLPTFDNTCATLPQPPVGWGTLLPDTGTQSCDTTTAPPPNAMSEKFHCIANGASCVSVAAPYFNVIPGQSYTLTGYARSDGTAPAAVCTSSIQGDSVISDHETCVKTLLTTWQFLSETITIPSGNDTLFVYIGDVPNSDGSGSPVAGTIWFQDIQIYANSAPGGIAGNAATATALAATPTQCSGGTPLATGIAANGNANCTPNPSASTIIGPLASVGITSTTVSNSSATLLGTITVSQPSACTWRINSRYDFHLKFTTNQADVSFAIWDGANKWGGSNTGTSNAVSGGDTGVSGGGDSSVTYSSSTTSVTLDLYGQSTSATGPTSEAATAVTFGAPISGTVPYVFQAKGVCMN